MLLQKKFDYYPYLLGGIAALLFLPFLGNVHLFDWDEINFAESAREMLLTGNYRRVQIDFQPFWEKPPLFFWLQTLSMQVFGINEYAARFPNAIFGILTILLLFFIGKKHYSTNLGVLWAMCYMGSILPHFYFKSGIIDPVFNFFIFSGIYFLARTIYALPQNNQSSWKYAAFAGLAVGLAILTKGPVGLLVPLLCFLVFAILKKGKQVISFVTLSIFSICAGLVSLAWFGLDIWENGIWFLGEFIQYQIELFTQPVAGHDQPFHYHFVVVFFGCFPISIIALPNLVKRKFENISPTDFPLLMWMQIMFWVVMILFSLSTTKIVHYSSLSYYPLTFLAAYQLSELIENKGFMKKWQLILLLIVGLIVALIFVLIPFVGMNTALISPYINDKFAVANLKAQVAWQYYDYALGIVYAVLVLVAYCLLSQQKNRLAVNTLLYGTALFLFVAMYQIVPKIERYTQGGIIDFYKTLAKQDVYIHTMAYKSYAHYFYPKIQPAQSPQHKGKERDEDWLLNGKVGKPVYIVLKVIATNEIALLRQRQDIKELFELNGFIVFKREVMP